MEGLGVGELPRRAVALIIWVALFFLIMSLAIPLLIPQPGVARPGVTSRADTSRKVVVLTFDDGPHPVFTPAILEILDQYQVKATFFMIGNRMEKYPGLVREVYERGHEIANHTYTHPNDLRTLPMVTLNSELDRTNELIRQTTGKECTLFRPPRGILNNRLVEEISCQGYGIYLWTVSADNRNAPTPELMCARVEKNIQPGGIILLHDGRIPSRIKDVAATRLIIKRLTARGYRFVTLTELIEAEHNPSPPGRD